MEESVKDKKIEEENVKNIIANIYIFRTKETKQKGEY